MSIGFGWFYLFFVIYYVGSKVNKDYPVSKFILMILIHLLFLCLVDNYLHKGNFIMGLIYTIYRKVFVEK